MCEVTSSLLAAQVHLKPFCYEQKNNNNNPNKTNRLEIQ